MCRCNKKKNLKKEEKKRKKEEIRPLNESMIDGKERLEELSYKEARGELPHSDHAGGERLPLVKAVPLSEQRCSVRPPL